MARNLITAVFANENPTRSIATPQSWQWDVGQILKIVGLDIPNGTQAHFIVDDQSITQLIGVVDGVGYVHVPDEFLQAPGVSTAYVYISESDTVAETEYTIMFTVRERVQPADYSTPTEAEETLFQEAIDAVRTYAERADSSADDAADAATLAESWAIGGTGTREGEDADNSKYYATQAGESAVAAASSEGNAAESETAAASSERNAASSESNAASSERNAAASERNAADYAGAASSSAYDAGLSETAAEGYANSASSSASEANTNALKAEGYAVGKQNGSDVSSGSTYYHNNAEYYADQAAAQLTLVTNAKDDALGDISTAKTNAVGDVNNAKTTAVGAVQDKGTEVLNSIPADYTTLSNDVSELKSDFDALGLSVVDGKMCVTWEVA